MCYLLLELSIFNFDFPPTAQYIVVVVLYHVFFVVLLLANNIIIETRRPSYYEIFIEESGNLKLPKIMKSVNIPQALI